jgi:L-threonylcarbamoyladenylate synthase
VIALADAVAFERCVADGGVAVFPADTVYGLACRPDSASAIARLYAIKGRQPDKPAALMFFDLRLALAAVPELGPRTTQALERLLPGGVTLLVDNPADRFPLACGADRSTLGLRVPRLEGPLAALTAVGEPVLQSSANVSGAPDARRLEDVPEQIRGAVDMVLDGGELPGTPSTVIDLRGHEDGAWSILREGAVDRATVERALSADAN